MKSKLLVQWIAGIAFLMSTSLVARDIVHNSQVKFDHGTNGATINNKIKGYETYNYKISAQARQYMRVSLETKNTATYFNIFEPGKSPGDAAMFIGSTSGNMFMGNLPTSGIYTVQVYMMRSAARRSEVSNYQLHIGID